MDAPSDYKIPCPKREAPTDTAMLKGKEHGQDSDIVCFILYTQGYSKKANREVHFGTQNCLKSMCSVCVCVCNKNFLQTF